MKYFCFLLIFVYFIHGIPKIKKIDPNILTGNIDTLHNKQFKIISKRYSARRNLFLQKDVLRAFIKMYKVAKKDGVRLYIVSATRTYDYQKDLWDKKYLSLKNSNEADELLLVQKILQYSAAPGTSRHHWGTDIDITYSLKNISLDNKYYERGRGLKAYNWLRRKAKLFGFCQPYLLSPSVRNGNIYTHGYQEEKWHWSYKPISKYLFESYFIHIPTLTFSNVYGGAILPDLYKDYIQNIHTECK